MEPGAEPKNMIRRTQSGLFLRNRKARRARLLRKMALMRAAKARKRMENPVQREPRMERWYPLEIGVRDKTSGAVGWVDFRSVRDAVHRLGAVAKWYVPDGASLSTLNSQLSTSP